LGITVQPGNGIRLQLAQAACYLYSIALRSWTTLLSLR
jgi:hypothetical protein